MCGITGIIANKGITSNELKKMTDIIRHRGPDGEGFAFFNKGEEVVLAGGKDTSSDVWDYPSPYKPTEHIEDVQGIFKIGFGHRRLAIIDLSACGHQPLSFDSGRYWITYNGEVYNYKELKKELMGLGYSFNSKTDTEVIIAAYAEWGVDCLQKFNGMWAFAIYDSVNEEIFISRDRFGIKPLYYWFSPEGNFSFASEIKQFTTLPDWKATINAQRAYDYLIYSITDHTEETMFDGVFQIPGGHYFKSKVDSIKPDTNRKIIPTKWYELSYNKYTGSFDEATSEFNRLFRSSVQLRLRADVPVGSALSGGLDSSAIVCEVNEILRSQGIQHLKKTFSSCSIYEKYDERKWIDIVVAKTCIEAHFVYPGHEDIFKLILKLTWQHDEPFQSLSPYLGYHVFESAAKNGVKVIFNGQGADEYLGGYGQFTLTRYSEMFWKMKWVSLIRDISKSRKYRPMNYSALFKSLLTSLVPSFLKERMAKNFGYYTEIKSLIKNEALGAIPLSPFDANPLKKNSVPEISKHHILHSTLPRYLKWEDRNSMANSIEARIPFLDYRLVEFSYNLPDDYFDFEGENKRVLREGLKGIVPEEIRTRKDKMGFSSPEERWLKDEDPALFRLKLKEAIEVSQGIIKPEALQYFDKVVKGKAPFDSTYWRFIQFAEWMKLYIIQKKDKTKATILNTSTIIGALTSENEVIQTLLHL